ncbi:hypothetical protein [Staphylococcus caeli]|uniref:hypothetical protein n=1 Tax=Staphylococcus caeli TaxID=2201815 RepID=UPI003F55D7F8
MERQKKSTWIISVITGILMFLVVFYIGHANIWGALIVGILGCISNMLITVDFKNKKKAR